MPGTLVVRTGSAPGPHIAAWSRQGLEASLEGDAELWVTEAETAAVLVGAFERVNPPTSTAPAAVLARRGSGGPSVWLGPASVHVQLRLAHPSALVACEPGKLVNRYVRPLLRGLTRLSGTSAAAHYFGRDWVSVAHRPAAWVGFAHDAGSGRATLEAVVAVRTPFAVAGGASLIGKEPITLAQAGALKDGKGSADVVRAIVDAFARAYDREPRALDLPAPGSTPDAEPVDPTPWRATIDEAIGEVGAGPDRDGVFRLGGSLLASRDAILAIEARAPALGEDLEVQRALVHDVFDRPGVALHGVRSVDRLGDLLVRALGP